MKITIETIPNSEQRYPTCGDYGTNEDGSIWIKVSDMGSEDYEFCTAIHELIEQWLCKKRGITEEDITAFDVEFASKRSGCDYSEPGDDNKAPYGKEHCFATGIERLIVSELNVLWNDYENKINSLYTG